MTPAQLDLVVQGAFIYERADGSQYASIDYKLRDMGVPCVGRAGPMTEADLSQGVQAYLDTVNARLAS